MSKIARVILIFSLVFVLAPDAKAQSHLKSAAYSGIVTRGYAVCGIVKGHLEVLFPEARTICQPGADNGKIAIVLASPLPAFRSFEAKRAWFIASVAIVGMDAREAGLTNFTTLYMMDSELARTLDAYAMPISRASQLQQQAKSDQLTADAYLAAVMKEMRPTKLPTRLYDRSH